MPQRLLFPAILFFICIGVYSVANSPFDVMTVIVFGIVGYLMNARRFFARHPTVPRMKGTTRNEALHAQVKEDGRNIFKQTARRARVVADAATPSARAMEKGSRSTPTMVDCGKAEASEMATAPQPVPVRADSS